MMLESLTPINEVIHVGSQSKRLESDQWYENPQKVETMLDAVDAFARACAPLKDEASRAFLKMNTCQFERAYDLLRWLHWIGLSNRRFVTNIVVYVRAAETKNELNMAFQLLGQSCLLQDLHVIIYHTKLNIEQEEDLRTLDSVSWVNIIAHYRGLRTLRFSSYATYPVSKAVTTPLPLIEGYLKPWVTRSKTGKAGDQIPAYHA
ncbi:hypothetical protein M011DRAFT_49942 [Sporormia fimetaria CBS 119925]|uniref:Uncharacterized protein n=1 Tax=Sporormia fimetaria CBS 119925 TaxID=1340428 RepID=A0A6A6VAK5_9PLEO|nr:hypothetical protein M011DRAFT_49942 [Sporormia fimetaria CBS 119925]